MKADSLDFRERVWQILIREWVTMRGQEVPRLVPLGVQAPSTTE
jgi:hypothetical protein